MTTKTISTTLTQSYTLKNVYSTLSLTKTGAIVLLGETVGVGGATGLTMPNAGTLTNHGYIYGGFGGNGDSATGHVGAYGGIGARITGASLIGNYEVIQGGLGGTGVAYFDTATGRYAYADGGTGGYGLAAGAGDYVNNGATGTIRGGGGGVGSAAKAVKGSQGYYDSGAGFGGVGGVGLYLGAGATLNTIGLVTGGRGGTGGAAPSFVKSGHTYTGFGGVGGQGGTGIYAAGPAVILNYATITGGAGGAGGAASGGTAGGTGAQGRGISLGAGGTIINGSYDDPGARINGGVFAGGGAAATIINYGVINGGGGPGEVGVDLTSHSRLVVEPGSDIISPSLAGSSSTLEFAGPRAGTASATITSWPSADQLYIATPTSNGEFAGFQTLAIDGSVQMSVAGSGTLGAGYLIDLHGVMEGAGTLTALKATASEPGAFVALYGGALEMGSLINSGQVLGYGQVTGSLYLDGGQFYAMHGNLDLSGATFSAMKGGVLGALPNCILQMPNNQDLSVLTVEALLAGPGAYIQELDTGAASQVTLDAALTSITASGQLFIENGRDFAMDHTMVNSGVVFMEGATISGGVLVDASAFMGWGEVDSGLTVQAGGTVDALGSLVFAPSTHAMVNQGLIDTSGVELTLVAAAVSNALGTIAIGGGTLALAGSGIYGGGAISDAAGGAIYALSGANTLAMAGGTIGNGGQIYTYGGSSLTLGHAHVANTGGTIQVGSASTLTLSNSAIYGGTLRLDPGGVISAVGTANTINLGGGAITNGGTIQTAAGGALTLNGDTIANLNGVIAAGTGPGHLLLSNCTVDGGKISIAAGGTIDAYYANNTLAMTGGTITNAGVIDTLHSAHLTISQASIANTGTILAQGYSGLITLTKDTVTGAGVLSTQASGGPGCEILIGDTSSVQVQGVQSNAGTIALASASGNTDLRILAGGASLTGGGKVALSGTKARILGTTAAATLTNVDNTLSGTGVIGANSLTLINQAKGVIDAIGAFGLTVGTKGSTLTNQGLMEATGGGTLAIVNTTVANVGGTILATNVSPVKLQDSVIRGGGITATGTGVVKFNVSGGELDGTADAVSLSGVAFIVNGSNETLVGSIANSGKINLIASTSTSDLIIGAAGATLSGGGQVNMTNSLSNRIYGLASGDTLTNVDNRIDGAGVLGNGVMTLVNQAAGQIIGNQNFSFTIDTGTNTILNAGLIENVGKGGTLVKSAVANTGTLLAATAGTLNLAGAVTGTGVGQINGGTLYVQQAFAEKVTFTGTTGVLELGASQAFTGTVTGLSKTGTDWLDLVDIGFFAAKTKATYSGTTASGTLTVTDGTHTAHITLIGNYIGSTWTVSADGHGGTKVVDPPAGATPLAQAISAFPAATAAPGPASWTPHPPPRQLLAHAQT